MAQLYIVRDGGVLTGTTFLKIKPHTSPLTQELWQKSSRCHKSRTARMVMTVARTVYFLFF